MENDDTVGGSMSRIRYTSRYDALTELKANPCLLLVGVSVLRLLTLGFDFAVA